MDAAQIYQDLGADDAGPIHCFGGSATIAAGVSGTVTCTPAGMQIRPVSIEMFSTDAGLALVTAITVGGLPIMHGGTMPGDSFLATATYKLYSALVASSNNPLALTLTSRDTASRTFYVGVKGPTQREK